MASSTISDKAIQIAQARVDAELYRMMTTNQTGIGALGSGLGNAEYTHGGHTHGYSNAAGQPFQTAQLSRWSETNLYNMLAMRMGWNITTCPFRHVTPVKLDELVVVFVCKDDKALLVDDDPLLYPSDALVTQLRLLLEVT